MGKNKKQCEREQQYWKSLYCVSEAFPWFVIKFSLTRLELEEEIRQGCKQGIPSLFLGTD